METIRIIMKANTAIATKKGYEPFRTESDGPYTFVYCTDLGLGDHATSSHIEVARLNNGKIKVLAGYKTENIDLQDGTLECGPIEGFFEKCHLAQPDNRNAVVVTLDNLQSLLEWAFEQIWNVQVECDGWAGLHVTRAWLP